MIYRDLLEIIKLQLEEIRKLKDEIARLKGEKGKPRIKPSTLEKPDRAPKNEQPDKKRPGSAKRRKTETLDIHREEIIKPETVPPGSTFKGYRDYTVQDVIIEPLNTLYRLECRQTPDGRYICGELPEYLKGSHFGVTLQSFILYPMSLT